MKVGDIVRHESGIVGQIFRIDKQYYGANSYIISTWVPRGQRAHSAGELIQTVRAIRDGIQDRLLVLWECSYWEYVKSGEVEAPS